MSSGSKGYRGAAFTRGSLLAGIIGLLALAFAPAAGAQDLADGFQAEVFASGFENPIAMDFAPDGTAYVAEKAGRVVRVDPDGSKQQVLDISGQVSNWHDRGLTGVAVDGQFGAHPYVYVVYTVKSAAMAEDAPSVGRVARYEVGPGGQLVNPAIILGSYPGAGSGCPVLPSNGDDCLPGEGGSHTTDLIRSAPDGTLYLSAGEGQYSQTRALDERSLAGKVLHFDRHGRGLEGHPFCPQNANLDHACTKVHAMGFRNPWRISLHPDGERVWVGDVGEGAFEELNLAAPGQSFGWPCYEGPNRFSGFSLFCSDQYNREGTPAAERDPWWHYPRADGITIVAGPHYTGDTFPPAYQGAVFAADTFGGWLRALKESSSGSGEVAAELGTGFTTPVHVELGLDGESMYVVELAAGRILRVDHTVENRRPRAVADAAPRFSAEVPLEVEFDATGSNDPDDDPLAYEWDFGDGSPTATGAQAAHTYTEGGTYTATLTVTDPGGLSDSDSVQVTAGNEPPEVAIDGPAPSFRYVAGQPVPLSGHAVDSDDGPVPDADLRWEIELHHNTHVHAFQDLGGGDATFRPNDDHDADSYYEITLHATDSGGLTGSTSIDLHPKVVELTLASSPSGATVSYGGRDLVAPATIEAGAGVQAQISAAQHLRYNSADWSFVDWRHGGTRSQTYAIPEEDTALYAQYAKQPVTADSLLATLLEAVDELLRDLGVPPLGLAAAGPPLRLR